LADRGDASSYHPVRRFAAFEHIEKIPGSHFGHLVAGFD
jgi:hypothetical protein